VSATPIHSSGTFAIGGELEVRRLGFGAMRITGKGIWGEPADPDEARAVLREAVALGVNFIDTAESYGPEVSERLIAEALHPYPEDLVIATKGGFDRSGPGRWHVNCRPERLREECEGSLRRLEVDRIDLWQLHRIDPEVPLEEQIGVALELMDEGKIRMFGLSEVSLGDLGRVQEQIDVVTVQNRFNWSDRDAQELLEACEQAQIGFIPWFPLAAGRLEPLEAVAAEHGATASQVALAWLLHRSPVMLPIPGTSSVAHLRENCEAAALELSADDLARL
jgi:pyridoxine 4-dehydrogenase